MTSRLVSRCTSCVAVMLGALVGSACASESSTVVSVTATDHRCVVPATPIRAGVTEIRVRNRGRRVTEVYVYSASGQVEGEIRNVARGSSRTSNLDLAAGKYAVVCKPGMRVRGIRTAMLVTGPGGRERPLPTARVDVSATDYAYQGLTDRVFRAGSTVAITLRNDAPVENHELEIFGPDGQAIGEIGPTVPAKTGRVVLTFNQPGIYEFVCGVEDHEEQGMSGAFRVR